MKKQFSRVKRLADQKFSKPGKSETLSDELQIADKKVEQLMNVFKLVNKHILPTGASIGQDLDPAARDKRLKKFPEYTLGLAMCKASDFEDDESILKYILEDCGEIQKYLATEKLEREIEAEQIVCSPLRAISDQDIPAIIKAKRHLKKLNSQKETASNKYHIRHHLERSRTKLMVALEDVEETTSKAYVAEDVLAADMLTLVAKEPEVAHSLLRYVKLQQAYHRAALQVLQDAAPQMEQFINDNSLKPTFGFSLEEHLKNTGRTIAFPIELCVCLLHELALDAEGVFRISGIASKVKRMKLSIEAGLFTIPLKKEYQNIHVIASLLKLYLQELPEPLLTYRLYNSFITASTQRTEQDRLNAIWETIHHLPEVNFQNLRYLIKFLSILTKNCKSNRMTPANLAIVMAPNLLWNLDEGSFEKTNSLLCVVESLIKHADWFYKDDVDFFISFTKEELLLKEGV